MRHNPTPVSLTASLANATVGCELTQPLQRALQSVLSPEKDRQWFPVFNALAHLVACILFQVRNLNSMRAVIRHAATVRRMQLGELPQPSRSTFADANNSPRRLKVVRQVFEYLVEHSAHLFSRRALKVSRVVAVDSSLLECVASAEWASYRKNVNGCKSHLAFDLNAKVPRRLVLSEGRLHDRRCFPRLLEKGWTYIVDRAYIDYRLFDLMWERSVFFVTRLKSNATYTVLKKLKVPRAAKKRGVRAFCEARLGQGPTTMSSTIHLVEYRDPQGKNYVFVTNRLDLAALTVAELYHARWGIETFFKWTKRTLRMERALGRSQVAAEMHVLITLILDILLKILTYRPIVPRTHVPLRTLEVIRDTLLEPWTSAIRDHIISTIDTG